MQLSLDPLTGEEGLAELFPRTLSSLLPFGPQAAALLVISPISRTLQHQWLLTSAMHHKHQLLGSNRCNCTHRNGLMGAALPGELAQQ